MRKRMHARKVPFEYIGTFIHLLYYIQNRYYSRIPFRSERLCLSHSLRIYNSIHRDYNNRTARARFTCCMRKRRLRVASSHVRKGPNENVYNRERNAQALKTGAQRQSEPFNKNSADKRSVCGCRGRNQYPVARRSVEHIFGKMEMEERREEKIARRRQNTKDDDNENAGTECRRTTLEEMCYVNRSHSGSLAKASETSARPTAQF